MNICVCLGALMKIVDPKQQNIQIYLSLLMCMRVCMTLSDYIFDCVSIHTYFTCNEYGIMNINDSFSSWL